MTNDFTGRFCSLHIITYILVLLGALNWGLFALGGYVGVNLNIVNLLLGNWPMLERAIYLVLGFSAVVMLFQSSCTYCKETTSP